MFPEKAIGDILCITSPNSDIIGLTFLLLSYTFMELILVASPSVLLVKLSFCSWCHAISGIIE